MKLAVQKRSFLSLEVHSRGNFNSKEAVYDIQLPSGISYYTKRLKPQTGNGWKVSTAVQINSQKTSQPRKL